MKRKITNNVFTKRESFLVLIVSLCCVFFPTNVNAAIITILDSSAEVLYPPNGHTFQVPNVTDVFNLTASGKGYINFKVITDNNPLTLYKKSWMFLDSYTRHSSESITFAANTITTVNWSIPLIEVPGVIGVGSHIASSKFEIYTDSSELEIIYLGSTIMNVIDTHIFEVAVVPEPATLSLLALGGLLLRRRKSA